MDIKRVAFETKPVSSRAKSPLPATAASGTEKPALPKREQIAEIVDSFLRKKLAEVPAAPSQSTGIPEPSHGATLTSQPADAGASPVKTVIHELRPQNAALNGVERQVMDFVSEADVRSAIDKGAKIYITAKTILTPAARDLGEEKEVFAKV
jgi:hypothetical protein